MDIVCFKSASIAG